MKKFYKYIVLMLLLAIGVFYGCSKSADMQTIPKENNSNYALNSCKNSEEPFVIPIIIRKEYYDDFFVENFKKLPSEMYFINSILAGYKSGEIWFNNEHRGKELINNLEAISTSYTLSNKKNYQGMINKLEGLVNRIPLTSNEITTRVIEAIITLTVEILQLEKDTQFIVPDYLDTWDDVENFFYSAHTQSIIIFIIIAACVAILGCGDSNKTINTSCWNKHMSIPGVNNHGGDKNLAYTAYGGCVGDGGGTVLWDINGDSLK